MITFKLYPSHQLLVLGWGSFMTEGEFSKARMLAGLHFLGKCRACPRISPIFVALLKALEVKEQQVLVANGECGWNYSTVNAEVADSISAGAAMGFA